MRHRPRKHGGQYGRRTATNEATQRHSGKHSKPRPQAASARSRRRAQLTQPSSKTAQTSKIATNEGYPVCGTDRANTVASMATKQPRMMATDGLRRPRVATNMAKEVHNPSTLTQGSHYLNPGVCRQIPARNAPELGELSGWACVEIYHSYAFGRRLWRVGGTPASGVGHAQSMV